MHKSYVSLLSDLKKKIILSKANLLPSWKFILFLLLSIQKQKIQISKNTWPMKSKSYLVGGESVPHNNFSILYQKIIKVCTLLKHMPPTTNLLCSQLETRLGVCDLWGADDPPLVLAPVHAQNFIPVPLQGPPGLHDKLAKPLHLLCHLMYCTNTHVYYTLNMSPH